MAHKYNRRFKVSAQLTDSPETKGFIFLGQSGFLCLGNRPQSSCMSLLHTSRGPTKSSSFFKVQPTTTSSMKPAKPCPKPPPGNKFLFL